MGEVSGLRVGLAGKQGWQDRMVAGEAQPPDQRGGGSELMKRGPWRLLRIVHDEVGSAA